jgi:hypothetical protein
MNAPHENIVKEQQSRGQQGQAGVIFEIDGNGIGDWTDATHFEVLNF